MNNLKIMNLKTKPDLLEEAATWFSSKWNIPKKTYYESMKDSFNTDIPQWYVVLDEQTIIAGLGVIENDFHKRKDLTPNVCAVYVEEAFRKKGIAGKMLEYVCDDMETKGIDTLYLITNHTSFYERYSWKFYDMVQEDSLNMTRMYIHKNNDLFKHLDQIYTTELGIKRIKNNLHLENEDVVEYCRNKIINKDCKIYKQGKNWYCEVDTIRITINASNFTIITAHLK